LASLRELTSGPSLTPLPRLQEAGLFFITGLLGAAAAAWPLAVRRTAISSILLPLPLPLARIELRRRGAEVARSVTHSVTPRSRAPHICSIVSRRTPQPAPGRRAKHSQHFSQAPAIGVICWPAVAMREFMSKNIKRVVSKQSGSMTI
jgi:hypothetical protein